MQVFHMTNIGKGDDKKSIVTSHDQPLSLAEATGMYSGDVEVKVGYTVVNGPADEKQGDKIVDGVVYRPFYQSVPSIVAAIIRDRKLAQNGKVTGGQTVDPNVVMGKVLDSHNADWMSDMGRALARAAGGEKKALRQWAERFMDEHGDELE